VECDRLSFTGAPPTDSPASLTVTIASLSPALSVIEASALTVTDALASMQLRASRGVSRTIEACDTLLASLSRAQARIKQAARASFHRYCNKTLVEQCEEAEANARLLDAVASMRDVRQLPALFVRDVDSLSLAFMIRGNNVSALLMCSCDGSFDTVTKCAVVYRDVVDASMSEVSGPGTVGFVWRDSARNAISLMPRLHIDEVAECVTVDDVAFVVSAGSAAVSVGLAGSFDCVYTVDEGVREIGIRISVCGVLVWSGTVRACDIMGRRLQSYNITGGSKLGLVVSPNGRYMAVSYYHEDKLRVYRVEADGAATLLHTVGTTAGANPKQFNNPVKMCSAPAGNLLVCEYGNDRVQELTGLGEAEPQHVRFIPIKYAWAIALHGDVLAVGTDIGTIELLSYASGALIRSISVIGSGPDRMGDRCAGLRFTPDGRFVVAAEQDNKRLSMFRASDGGFAKHIGAGVLANGNKDVQFAQNGELLVADFYNHRVCVLNADGDTLLRTWGTHGSADGQFKLPTALALVDSKLFVLDFNSARVQVFE
jgi:hypothetical protein